MNSLVKYSLRTMFFRIHFYRASCVGSIPARPTNRFSLEAVKQGQVNHRDHEVYEGHREAYLEELHQRDGAPLTLRDAQHDDVTGRPYGRQVAAQVSPHHEAPPDARRQPARHPPLDDRCKGRRQRDVVDDRGRQRREPHHRKRQVIRVPPR